MNHIRVHSIPGTLHFYQPRQFYPVHLLQQLTYIQKFISSFTHTNTLRDSLQSRPFSKCTYNYPDAYNKDIRKNAGYAS